MKAILLDTETTGVNLVKNDIWQVAGFIIIDNKVVDTFNIKFAPPESTEFSKGAMEKINKSLETLLAYQPSADGFAEFTRVLDKYIDRYDKTDKFHLIAYNAHFDTQFLRKWFKQNSNSFYGAYFYSNNIDIMTLASEFLKSIRSNMVNFKLQTVYRTLVAIGLLEELDFENSHDALFDIAVEYKIYDLFRIENIEKTLKQVKKLGA